MLDNKQDQVYIVPKRNYPLINKKDKNRLDGWTMIHCVDISHNTADVTVFILNYISEQIIFS
jgi:hypothetical protein